MSLRFSKALSVRIAAGAVLLAGVAVIAAACTINPQPLPPDAVNGSSGSPGDKTGDGGTTGFGGGSSDAAAPPTSPDGGTHVADAGADGSIPLVDGGSDAATDAQSDAPNDAPEDG